MKNQEILQKINNGDSLTDNELFEFFDLYKKHGSKYDPDTDISELMSEIASTYHYGGDEIFYVFDQQFCAEQHNGDWFIVDFNNNDWEDDDIAAMYISEYYSDDLGVEESLSLWGLDYKIEEYSSEVDENYNGEVSILMYQYYGDSTIRNTYDSHWIRDDNNFVIYFNNYKDAEKWIDDALEEEYVLSYGEYSRPDYYILETPPELIAALFVPEEPEWNWNQKLFEAAEDGDLAGIKEAVENGADIIDNYAEGENNAIDAAYDQDEILKYLYQKVMNNGSDWKLLVGDYIEFDEPYKLKLFYNSVSDKDKKSIENEIKELVDGEVFTINRIKNDPLLNSLYKKNILQNDNSFNDYSM